VGLVWYVGKGISKKVRGFAIHLRLLGNVELSFGEWWTGMEKEVCTFCVILMEDG
jgi:hypothetical protein